MKLFQYIRGTRRGKEINRLEREAMRDPFLADALEGFDKVAGDDHEWRIKEVRTEISKKTESGKRSVFRYWSIAASILLFIGCGGYFLLHKNQSGTRRNLASTQLDLYIPEKSFPAQAKTIIQSEKPLLAQAKADNKKEAEPDMAVQESRCDDWEEMQMETVTVQESGIVEPDMLALIDSVPVSNIRGIVIDHEGVPLPGASIVYAGTNMKVASDAAGYFELPQSKEKEIQVSYIGYEPVNLVVDTSKTMLVEMRENTDVLDEIVVVAFGKQKRKSMIGSVEVKKENIKPRPVIGKKKYKKYLKENVIMLQSEACRGKKGKVRLKFMVDMSGRPVNIRVEKSLCPEADHDAIRLIMEGSDWTEGNCEAGIDVEFGKKRKK
jgi:hypothetical protein